MKDDKFYVYCWYYGDTEQIFYIGKGTGDRYKSINGRSKLFLEIIEDNFVKQKILIDGLNEEMALMLEKMTIRSSIRLRHPLINMVLDANTSQREGIRKAKEQGKYKGRKPIDYSKEIFNMNFYLWKQNKITAIEFMKQLNVKKTTFYKIVKNYEVLL